MGGNTSTKQSHLQLTQPLQKFDFNGDSYHNRSKRSLEKKEEPVPSPSMSGLQRTPKAEHQSRKRTVSQSSTSLSSGAGSGKEGGHSTKGNSTSKHRKGEDKGRSTRDGKVGLWESDLVMKRLPARCTKTR